MRYLIFGSLHDNAGKVSFVAYSLPGTPDLCQCLRPRNTHSGRSLRNDSRDEYLSRDAVFEFGILTATRRVQYWPAIYANVVHMISHLNSLHHPSIVALLVILLSSIINNVEESELVDTLARGDNTEPISQLLLLEELLGPVHWVSYGQFHQFFGKWYSQVLEIPARELRVRNNLDLSIRDLRDLHGITEISDAAIDLDLVLEELLEGGDVKDLVAGGLRSVDDELLSLAS